jgi:hypothetical protein
MGVRPLGARGDIVLGGFSWRDRQKPPASTSEYPRGINHLSGVVRHVCQRSKQSFLHAEALSSDSNGLGQVCITQGIERTKQRRPPAVPVTHQFGALHGARRELVLAVTPRLLTVCGEELGEAGAQVTSDVPTDGGDGVSALPSGGQEFRIFELREGSLYERLIAQVLSLNGQKGCAHVEFAGELRVAAADAEAEVGCPPHFARDITATSSRKLPGPSASAPFRLAPTLPDAQEQHRVG